jgi:hypothetical protein
MKRIRLAMIAAVFFTMSAGQVWAHASYMGYSGAPGCSGTCAGSCHGGSGGTVAISGFPQSYTPNQQYLITIRKLSGSSIRNFNASCRIGTGSQNAGTIAAGTGTSTYNTSGETNGVHLSSINQDSATFSWTAPTVGTGNVRLYVGALQGNYSSGLNTVITVNAAEAVVLPDAAANPSPADSATEIAWNMTLSWMAGSAAASHDVYFGAENPPSFVGNQTATSYDPAGDLLPDTVYYWRIDERNDAGVTEGNMWSFRTAAASAAENRANSIPSEMTLGPAYPNPFNATLTISFALPQAQDISLTAYDILGRQAAVLAHGRYSEGIHRLQWSSQNIGTGIYFLRLQSASQTLTMKVAALK